MAVVDELVTLFGFRTDPAAAGEATGFQQSIANVRRVALVAGTALVTLTGITTALSKRFSESTDEAKKFSDSLDFDFSTLQELEFATQIAGGSIEDLRGDIANLTKTYGDGEKALEQLAAQFDGLSNIRSQQLGNSLGLSQGTILLLQQGSERIAELRAEAGQLGGIIPADLANQTAEFNDELVRLSAITTGINAVLQATLIPAFTETTQSLRVFLVENQELITSGLGVFIDGVSTGFSQLIGIIESGAGALIEFLNPLFEFTEGLEFAGIISNSVIAFMLLLGAILAPIAIKFLLIGAAITTVAVAIDDLITFFQGGESAIGAFFDAFENRFPGLFELLSVTLDQFKMFFNLIIEGWKLIGEGALAVLPDIAKFGESVINALEAGANLLGFGRTESPTQDSTPGAPLVEGLATVVEATGTTVSNTGPASQATVPASIVNNTSSQQGGNVEQTFNINGAGDPRAVAGEVSRRSNLGAVTQTLTPGQRAPRVA